MTASALAVAGLPVGLLLIWYPLKSWLSTLERVRQFEQHTAEKLDIAEISPMRDTARISANV